MWMVLLGVASCYIGGAFAEETRPVTYSYTAVAVAFFDANHKQVGGSDFALRAPAGTVGAVPDRFPSVGELINWGGPISYVISQEIGSGTDSVIYRATPAVSRDGTEKDVAVKFQKFDDLGRAFSVETEYEVLARTAKLDAGQSEAQFPEVYYLSDDGVYTDSEGSFHLRYMVMELLGSPVWRLMRKGPRGSSLSPVTMASIGIQLTESLESLHSLGIVHGDIHPENILFTYGDVQDADGDIFTDKVVLGDFGKSSMYVNPKTHQHIPDTPQVFNDGRNLLYLSPFELGLGTASRREDIFRLIETLARMCGERLYTQALKKFQNNRIALLQAKENIDLGYIIPTVPHELVELYNYARKLSFTETPDYSMIKKKLRTILTNMGQLYSGSVILAGYV